MRGYQVLAAVSSIALAVSAQSAWAQTAESTPEEAGDEIVVSGIRASLQDALNTKRQASVISDVISAEDIGKFPDRNVAEALQRVPGIVINREFGEGERVSLRGTAPNLTKTMVNGHNIATADWFILEQLSATRSFNYLTLPSEIVGRLEVYKSPQADVEEGGIGGTINVTTRNPLDLDPFSFSGSIQGVYSERRGGVDPQLSGVLSWHNDDKTFGVLVGGFYQKRDIRRDGIEVLGYMDATVAGQTVKAPALIGSALFLQERERYGGNIGIQFSPSDALDINITGLYSRFGANNFNQNYLAWTSNALGGGGTLTNATVRNGTAVSGTVTSSGAGTTGRAVVFDAIDREAVSTTFAADFDMVWRPSDRGNLHFKFGYTKADGDTVQQPFYEGGAPGAFTYDLTGGIPRVSFSGLSATNPAALDFDFGSLHQVTNDDKEVYVYADYEHEVDLGPINALKVGFKYTDHDRVTTFLATTYGGFFLPLLASGCGGAPCTSSFFAGGTTPSDFLGNIGGAGVLRSYWTVDRAKLQTTYGALPANVRARIILPSENHSINEQGIGGYVMAKFGGDDWRGNFGVRVIQTKQTSTGNVIGVPAATPGVVTGNAFGDYLPTTVRRSYTDVLPSINVSFDLNPELVLRVAAGRTMARPDYTDIVPRISLNPGSLTASGGNPNLNPYRANQFDVSLEWYPSKDTIVAAAVYYKDVESYITDAVTQQRFPVQTATPNLARCNLVNAGNNLYDCLFDTTIRSNGPGGTNKGFEFQLTQQIFGGFGVQANYTFSDASVRGGGEVSGNSKHTLNLSGFFENDLLSARLSYNYRSKFFVTFDRASPLNQQATSSLDASLSVNLTDNIALSADVINITNHKIRQFSGIEDRPRAIYDNGRQIYFGARVKF